MSFNLKFWGVRGSVPSSLSPIEAAYHFEGLLRNFFSSGYRDPSQIAKYIQQVGIPQLGGFGTATTCVEASSAKSQLIIDGGSGIRSLSERIMTGATGRFRGPFHIYLTHFHWDHLIGLPFFAPHFIPGSEIHYYAVHEDLEKLIRGLFQRPYFPVPFEALKAKIFFHKLSPREPMQIGDFQITPYELDHPDPCWGLKVQLGDKAYSHCVDTEGTRVTPEELGLDLPLYQNVDLMYFDAQYTLPELAEKANWGHSAAQVGLEIALREGIKKVLFAHHDPGAGIGQIIDLKRQTQEYYESRQKMFAENGESTPQVEWDFAHEGLEIKL